MLPVPALIVSEEPVVIHTAQSVLNKSLWSVGFSTFEDARQRIEQEETCFPPAPTCRMDRIRKAFGLLRSLAASRKTCCTVAHTHAGEQQVADLLRAGVADCVRFPQDLPRFKEFLRDHGLRSFRLGNRSP